MKKHKSLMFSRVVIFLIQIICMFIVALFMELPIKIKATSMTTPIISGNSIYRTSETTARIRLMSNKDGTIYYKIDNNLPNANDLLSWTNGGEVTANTLITIELNELTTEVKSVYFFELCR